MADTMQDFLRILHANDPSTRQVVFNVEDDDRNSVALGGEGIGDDGATRLAGALVPNVHVTTIHLSGNGIGAAGMRALARVINTDTSVCDTLVFWENNFDAALARVFDVILRSNSLARISLSTSNVIDARSVEILTRGLAANSSVQFLHLNCFDARGAVILAEGLAENSSVHDLNLNYNALGVAGFTAIAGALRVNISIRAIRLGATRMCAMGARAIAEALHVNATLEMIGLSRNDIGIEGVTAFAAALRVNSSVRAIHFGRTNFDDECARLLAEEVIPHNTSLEEIDLSNNIISDVGVRLFADALLTNSSLESIGLCENDGVTNMNLVEFVDDLLNINHAAPNAEEAHRRKIVRRVKFLVEEDGEIQQAVHVVLDRLGDSAWVDQHRGLLESLLGSRERGEDVAASVDIVSAQTFYRYATNCGAAPEVLMNVLRAHPSLCTCWDEGRQLYPFMLLATMPEAGVGDVMDVLQMNPTLVAGGICQNAASKKRKRDGEIN